MNDVTHGTGPQCPCCQGRNMQRMGYSLYRCQESGETFLFIVDAREEKGYRMAPLPKLDVLEAV